jgi:hypothetical protein
MFSNTDGPSTGVHSAPEDPGPFYARKVLIPSYERLRIRLV